MKFLSNVFYLMILFCGLTCVNNLFGAYLQLASLDMRGDLVPTREFLKVDGDVVAVTQNKAEATRFKCFYDPERQRPGFCEIAFKGKYLFVDDSGCFQLIDFNRGPSDLVGWVWGYKQSWAGQITDYYVYEVEGCCRVLICVD